jgi:hypothetical protein
MPGDGDFAVFSRDKKGRMWRRNFPDLEIARVEAQMLAAHEGLEFFVFSLKDSREVERFYPKNFRRRTASRSRGW